MDINKRTGEIGTVVGCANSRVKHEYIKYLSIFLAKNNHYRMSSYSQEIIDFAKQNKMYNLLLNLKSQKLY
jgi:hypothetical protein